MCVLVCSAASRGEEQVIADARRVVSEPEGSHYIPADPREFASRIFHTSYMGTENSSAETRKRAKDLAHDLGRCSLLHFICSLESNDQPDSSPNDV